MNYFDIFLLGITGLSVIVGIYQGFIKTLVGFGIFVLSLLGLYFLPSLVSKHWNIFGSDHFLLSVVVLGVGTYLFLSIALSLFKKMVYGMIDPITGGIGDRALGGVLGLVRAGVIIFAIFSIINVYHNYKVLETNDYKGLFRKVEDEKLPATVSNSCFYKSFYLKAIEAWPMKNLLSISSEQTLEHDKDKHLQ